MTKYAETLLGILEEKGLRKSDLVNNLHIPDSTVRGWWSKDSMPALDIAFKVADFLNVPLEYFITGKPAKEKKNEKTTFEKKIELLSAEQKKALESVIDTFLSTDAGKTETA